MTGEEDYPFIKQMLIEWTDIFEKKYYEVYKDKDEQHGIKSLINTHLTGLVHAYKVQINISNSKEKEESVSHFLERFVPFILKMFNIEMETAVFDSEEDELRDLTSKIATKGIMEKINRIASLKEDK